MAYPLKIPSQPIKVQTASRDSCLLANIYKFICFHLLAIIRLIQNQIIASRWMHIKCLWYVPL